MALPSSFDQAEFAAAMERLQEGTSAADEPARPLFNLQQHMEVVEECVHGRRIEDFKMALERGGFTYWPKGSIPPGCEARGPLEPPRPLVEGQWRRPRDRRLGTNLAFTEAQVLSWFSSPEEFWKWLEGQANQWKLVKAAADRNRRIGIAVPR